jgi:predicted amidophosphoribosyltransferase
MKQYVNEYDEALDALTSGMLDTGDIEPYMDTIIKALKKQIPRKAEKTYWADFHNWEGRCPACGEPINSDFRYCHECGQWIYFDEVYS